MCELTKPNYELLLSSETLGKVVAYKQLLEAGPQQPGAYLSKQLEGVSLADLTTEQFIGFLLKTKVPCIFAESKLRCDGSDWTPEEVSILGDICVAVEVTVFDNGVWSTYDPQFIPYDEPFPAHLLFVPGALLSNPNSPDLKEVLDEDKGLSFDKYATLMCRRLMPVFDYINDTATERNKALVTLPGIGCGLFAGDFIEVFPGYLEKTLFNILSNNHKRWINIDYVVFVPYKGKSTTSILGHISYRVRPYLTHLKPQLSMPAIFQETHDNQLDDFSQYHLYKLVAWDHLSYPGSDYYLGKRHTDNGVSAAATDVMSKLLGVEGSYDGRGYYKPPKEFLIWNDVVKAYNIGLYVHQNLRVAVETPKN
ncbi:uncharacterized protein LOC111258670 [Varroa jacobsoni]|uniref:uncharacterized protein LOC111258670 n=1 Tax=Varroa jacobsoni TaxID=62625 RepID=UPI000BF4D500|nr:uncharacterized protein LOC111258670 [Varroa jacobsoni]